MRVTLYRRVVPQMIRVDDNLLSSHPLLSAAGQ
jgi:hypothetical protein